MAQSSFQGFPSPRPDKKGNSLNIKSQQTGLASITAGNLFVDVTVSSIDPTKCILFCMGFGDSSTLNANSISSTGVILNATTIRFTRQSSAFGCQVRYGLIEFYNVKSRQSGSVAGVGGTAGSITSITITSVNIAKCIVFSSILHSSTSFFSSPNFAKLLNATTLEIASNYDASLSASTFEWQVIEFY